MVMPMTTSFQVMLQNFFVKRLMNQRRASPCTVAAYRDTFRLLLRYMRDQKGISPACITIDTLDAATVVEFLSYLRNTRLNSDATVNHRLAAIHSFFDYVSYEQPEHMATARRILGIPFRSTDRKVVNYLTREEMTLLLNSCDTSSFRGRRDRVIVLLLYNTGIRVSELVNLKRSDVTISADGKGYVRVLGKGRKERVIPLWRTTQRCLSEHFRETGCSGDDYILSSTKHGRITRSGVRYRLDVLTARASEDHPFFRRKRITPHVLRHTTAMHLLQAGIDISTIALWLGHESLDTTHRYMEADLALKEKALSRMGNEPDSNGRRYRPNEDILSFLDSL